MTLPKQNRITKNRAFTEVFASTRPILSEHFSIRASRKPQGIRYKLSVLISSKLVDRATMRNTLRRKITAAIARILRVHTVAPGTSVVISVKKTSVPEPRELDRELLSLLHKSGILNA